MKVSYIVALLMIVLIVGCAAPEAPPAAAPAAPAEAPPVPEAPAEEAAPAEEEAVEGPAAVDADIQILKRAFDPEELTVSAGSTVTWVNMDDMAVHSLSIIDKGVICPRKQTGEICEYTFDEAGTYEVMDLVNKFRGTITVTGGEEAAEGATE